MDFQLDNEFDSFIRQRKMAKDNRVRSRKERIIFDDLNDNSDVKSSSVNNRRLKIQSRNKGLLARIRDGRFLNNRNNHQVVYNEMKGMAVEIDELHKKLSDAYSQVENKICSCGKKINDNNYSNFVDTTQNRNRLLLLGVVTIGLLFFTPLGKNLLK